MHSGKSRECLASSYPFWLIQNALWISLWCSMPDWRIKSGLCMSRLSSCLTISCQARDENSKRSLANVLPHFWIQIDLLTYDLFRNCTANNYIVINIWLETMENSIYLCTLVYWNSISSEGVERYLSKFQLNSVSSV